MTLRCQRKHSGLTDAYEYTAHLPTSEGAGRTATGQRSPEGPPSASEIISNVDRGQGGESRDGPGRQPRVFRGRAKHQVPKTVSTCESSQKPEPGAWPSERAWPKCPTKAEAGLPRIVGIKRAWSQEKGRHWKSQAKRLHVKKRMLNL